MHRRWSVIVTSLIAVVLLASTTGATAGSNQAAPGESNLGYLFAGFAVAWVGFFVYAFYIAQKNRELRREVDELRRQVSEPNPSVR